MVQGRQEGGANRRRPTRSARAACSGAIAFLCNPYAMKACSYSLRERWTTKWSSSTSAWRRRMASRLSSKRNIGLLFGQLAQQASDALGHGRIGGAVTKQGLGALGGCLRLRPHTFLLKALRFFHGGVEVGGHLGPARARSRMIQPMLPASTVKAASEATAAESITPRCLRAHLRVRLSSVKGLARIGSSLKNRRRSLASSWAVA